MIFLFFIFFHKVALSITLFSSHKFIVLVINYLQSYSLIISFVSPGDIKGAMTVFMPFKYPTFRGGELVRWLRPR